MLSALQTQQAKENNLDSVDEREEREETNRKRRLQREKAKRREEKGEKARQRGRSENNKATNHLARALQGRLALPIFLPESQRTFQVLKTTFEVQ